MIPKNFPLLPYSLTNEQWETVVENWADWAEAQIEAFQQHMKDNKFPSMREMSPDQRFAYYVTMTDPLDFQLLQQPDYIDKYRKGLYPILKSPRWQTLMSIPDLFQEVRSDFLSLYRRRVGAA